MKRFLQISTIALMGFSLAQATPPAALAGSGPDFYGTITQVSADHHSITVSPTKDQNIQVDVTQLGSEPWDNGAFALNNVVLLHTDRIDNTLVATGWEEARNGSENFSGVEERPRRDPREGRGEH